MPININIVVEVTGLEESCKNLRLRNGWRCQKWKRSNCERRKRRRKNRKKRIKHEEKKEEEDADDNDDEEKEEKMKI